MKVVIRPKKLEGCLNCVPSKSYSHRAIIAASLASGRSTVKNLLFSNDIMATIGACRAIGAEINIFENYVEINGVGGVKRMENTIDANESGSTIRFMIPVALVNNKPITFTGKNNLVKRPLDTYLEIFDKDGISYEKEENYLPLKVNGGLKPGIYNVRGDVSSQFITGLLYALPLLEGNSVINITTELESKAYIDLTLDILELYGIKIINEDYKTFIVKGNQKYKAADYTVEGDYSQAAFFLVAGALGNNIKLKCMNNLSLQGDKKIIEDLKAFGADVVCDDDLLYATNKNKAHGCEIDFSQSPDLGPIESVFASLVAGNSRFYNAERLRIKECDRITCVKEELNKLGCKVSETESEMLFSGVDKIHGGEVSSHNDHRLAMAFAILATVSLEPITITGAEAVRKSYPTFWEDYRKLGGDFDELA